MLDILHYKLFFFFCFNLQRSEITRKRVAILSGIIKKKKEFECQIILTHVCHTRAIRGNKKRSNKFLRGYLLSGISKYDSNRRLRNSLN